jgi:3-hydroxyisobutyrate dehydrogenase-like beta-hydroxyacid dehydrogenase
VSEERAVGVIGIGLLGRAVSEVLTAAGYQVIGHDVLPERIRELTALGGRAAPSAAEVARAAGPVFTVLPTLASVDQAITGPGGVLEGAGPATVIIQMSTISPDLAMRMEAAARARGAALLDAPVSGTSDMVARRESVVTVGGEPAAFERCRPVLEALARRVYHVGRCGMGSLLKLVTNLAMGLNTVALAEALTLARRAGLDPAQTIEILSQGAASSKMLEVRGPKMAEGRFDPLMKIDLFLKDIRLMLEAGQDLHVPLPLTAAMQQLFTAALAGGQDKDDLAGIIRLYERMAGMLP